MAEFGKRVKRVSCSGLLCISSHITVSSGPVSSCLRHAAAALITAGSQDNISKLNVVSIILKTEEKNAVLSLEEYFLIYD